MGTLDKWSAAGAASLMVLALLACKKKEEEAPPPVATPAATPEPPKEEPKTEEKKDEVKRYGSEETEESGTVRVAVNHAKVYKETDDTTDHMATLSAGTLVNRKARKGNWMLIDYPSGPGTLSPGWILTKQLAAVVLKVKPEEVTQQDAGVVVAQPTATTSASAAPSASVAASAAPTTSASAAPSATTTATAEPSATVKKGRLKLPTTAK